ncbi:ATPase [Artemisia annua]|uniref:ATPase n=1 Tax=Artemisia annua TaxID=35608 RepID=A0A2U1MLF7_ARTAN|nr:ATPase [Artemisia annua]
MMRRFMWKKLVRAAMKIMAKSFKAIMEWWKEMAQNSKANEKPVVMKGAQNVAKEVVRTRSTLSAWSCMGARRLPVGNAPTDDFSETSLIESFTKLSNLIEQWLSFSSSIDNGSTSFVGNPSRGIFRSLPLLVNIIENLQLDIENDCEDLDRLMKTVRKLQDDQRKLIYILRSLNG